MIISDNSQRETRGARNENVQTRQRGIDETWEKEKFAREWTNQTHLGRGRQNSRSLTCQIRLQESETAVAFD